MKTTKLAALAVLAVAATLPAAAEEWTSWRGPHQNGVSMETGLVDSWSPDGENLIWRQPFTGRSTPVVMGGRVFVNGRVGESVDREAVIAAFDAASGRQLWERRFPVYLSTVPFNRVGWASLTGDPETGYIYAQLVHGMFVCLDRDGKTVWSRSFKEDFGRFEGYGGRTAPGVIDEDRIIVNMINSSWGPLGPPRHRYYAFDKRNGDLLWISTPGGLPGDRNTQAVPVVAVVGGQRLVLGANGDGHLYAVQARTGKEVWDFWVGKGGLNASPVVSGDTVYISHSEENVDVATLGRILAIDGRGSGDITSTHELWRIDEIQAGFPSPLLHGGRLYVVDNSANLMAIDQASGKKYWELSLGTVGKASPVWADGRIYAPETNGRFNIVEPREQDARLLHQVDLSMPNGRYAEFYGSPAIAYGRIYFATEEGVYCLGRKDSPFRAAAGEPVTLASEGAAEGPAATLQVVPGEVNLAPGERATFEVRSFDARGRALGTVPASLAAKGLPAQIDGQTLAVSADAGLAAGMVTATAGDLSAQARVRVFPALPWTEDFSGGRRPWWIGAGRYEVRGEAAEAVLVKPVAESGLLRSNLMLGPASLTDYTIASDLKLTQTGRRRADAGVINSGYILDLMGTHQRVQLRSWTAMLRIDESIDFPLEMDRWYSVKLEVKQNGGTASVRGKVWPQGEPEPSAWTVSAEDPHPVVAGAPGLTGYSPSEAFYDNVKITRN